MTLVRVGTSVRGNALVKWSVWKFLDHVFKVCVQGSDSDTGCDISDHTCG